MPVYEYPSVIGEVETIAKIKEGFSIARFGDGEFGAMNGKGYTREPPNKTLAKELQHVVKSPRPTCLVGIPTMDHKGPRYKHIEPSTGKEVGWFRHKERYCQYLSPDVTYYSSLITRPNCGEWMMTTEYAKLLQSIWLGKKTVLIGSEGQGNKMLGAVRLSQEPVFIECPWSGAYKVIGDLQKKALSVKGAEIILISAGVTATCLANRIAKFMQAVDIGSIGGFLCTMLQK
jgi:hypothetical protein